MAHSALDARPGTLELWVLGGATSGAALAGYLVTPLLDDTLYLAAALVVAGIIALGASLLARRGAALPALGRLHALTAWVPPVSWYAATLLAGRLLALDPLPLLALGAAGGLAVLLAAQQRELALPAGGHRAAEFVVNLGVFASAFVLFVGVREAPLRGLGSALVVGAVAAVLATVPLRRALARAERTVVYAVLTGLIVGQMAWALAYWALPAVLVGALLLLLFYVLVGLGEAMLDRSFDRRLLVEYGVVGACGLALILGVGPWRA
ncbi:MAG TPA: hypothetical protein VKZ60_13290 [Chloroflexota bacterium]|jgi:hypothetical protein|nr:hypothetical protein [Chloroflexota bacterium]